MQSVRKYFFLLSLLIFSGQLFQQDTLALIDKFAAYKKTETGIFPKQLDATLKNLSISGYYRFCANYMHMKVPYANSPSDTVSFASTPKKIFIGDDSQIPELMLTISGRPNSKASFGTDFYLWNKMTGVDSNGYVKGLNLGVNLYGNFSTDLGNFNIMTGGIHWYSLSPFTFFTNVGYNRYMVFERNPWDPVSKEPIDRYKAFHQYGNIVQDTRWGKQAFQGIIVEGNDFPLGISGVLMYGKSVLNGGFSNVPNGSTGGKIKKSFGNNFVSLNTFNSKTYIDSLNRQSVGFSIHTLEYRFTIDEITFSGELGMGKYLNPLYTRGFLDSSGIGKFGEAINFKFLLPNKYLSFPIEINIFRINSNVINNNSIFWNSSIREIQPNATATSGNAVLTPFASSVVQIGQLTNNRQGINLNADFGTKNWKISIGNSVSQEIENISSQIAFSHPSNNLALSRFWRWSLYPTPEIGPYGKLTKVYRGMFETLNITDTAQKIKNFNVIEIYSKLNFKLLGRESYFNYFGSFNSVQTKLSPVTVFSEKAYLRAYYHQFELFVKVNRNFIWTNYFAWERNIANYQTQVDEITRRPINQEGLSFATGFDLSLGKNAVFVFRNRWMDYHDYSFKRDKYIGMETSVELKISF